MRKCVMPLTDTRSLQQIKRETEQTRAGLTDTVEQLKTSVAETASDIRHRISPDAIKAEVSGYIRSRGEQLMNDVTAAARRNPMQAVAVGASIAYPLLRLARAIPLPVLMVGAGVFLAGSKAGQSATQKASDLASDLSDEVRRRSHDLSEEVSSSIDAAKDIASNTVGRASDMISTGADQIRGSAASAGSELNSASDRVRDGAPINSRAGKLRDGATKLANSAADATRDFTADTAAAARSAAASAKDSAS